MIACSGIAKSYGSTTALQGISFSVKRGEIFGIVGPDGAGKSTLMKIIATTLEPDCGFISIDGIDVAKDLFHARENIAYMPQRFGLYEDLTVEENAFFFGHLFGVKNSEIKKRLVKLYDFSKLGEFKDRRAGKLSGGMKQKLGLVCALIHTPKILILDEPTHNPDDLPGVETLEFTSRLIERKLADFGAEVILHGHTHKRMTHQLASPASRIEGGQRSGRLPTPRSLQPQEDRPGHRGPTASGV